MKITAHKILTVGQQVTGFESVPADGVGETWTTVTTTGFPEVALHEADDYIDGGLFLWTGLTMLEFRATVTLEDARRITNRFAEEIGRAATVSTWADESLHLGVLELVAWEKDRCLFVLFRNHDTLARV